MRLKWCTTIPTTLAAEPHALLQPRFFMASTPLLTWTCAKASTLNICTAQHRIAQDSTAQHRTAQHSTAQHGTAQHSTARHACTWIVLTQVEVDSIQNGVSFVVHTQNETFVPFHTRYCARVPQKRPHSLAWHFPRVMFWSRLPPNLLSSNHVIFGIEAHLPVLSDWIFTQHALGAPEIKPCHQ